ncbi:nucleoid-associated protein [Neisseriaceae bacterium JH1-16]|nr:nucleoid-associated protein [Neisseriaceae bacterium JH1-16]
MLIDESRVERLVVHRVGNPARDESLQLSERASSVDDEVSGLLLDGYLKGIVSDKKKHQFFHESELNLNEIYHYSRQFFRGELDFLEVSHRIAKHLYARSQHPNISAGDLLVILFSGLSDGETSQRGLGVFKSEIRDEFLTLVDSGDVIDIRHATGINPKLIDKGALILESGPTVYAVDRLGHSAKFWLDDFLKAMRVPDAASSSRMVASVVEQLSSEIEDPVEQSRFKDEVLTLCDTEEEVSASQFSAAAEKYVPREQVSQAFDSAAESYGFALDDEARLPAQNVAKRLERTLSKVNIPHGISLLLPSGMTLQNVQTLSDEGELTVTLTLARHD